MAIASSPQASNTSLQDYVLDIIKAGEFFTKFNNTTVVLTNSTLQPYDQQWTPVINPLNKQLYWGGLVPSNVTISMVVHAGGLLTSSVAGNGEYPGTYNMTILAAERGPVFPPGDLLILGVQVRLSVPAVLEDGTVVVTQPNIVTTITGNLIFLTFPSAVASDYFTTHPTQREACLGGTFSPPMVCAAAGVASRTALDPLRDGGPGSGGGGTSAVAWAALGLGLAAVVLAVGCYIFVAKPPKPKAQQAKAQQGVPQPSAELRR